MSFHAWFENLKSTCGLGSSSRALSRPARRKPAPSRRLQIDALEDRCLLSTFTVLNTLDSGAGSFRDAINQVNADIEPGIDTINFAIGSGVQTIVPLSPLPALTNPVVIDGTTQPGFAGQPLIELNGASAGTAASGLTIAGGNSTVKDLVINGFRSYGIVLATQGGDTLTGNYIGTGVTGTVRAGNAVGGVLIISANNTIGGTTPGDGNLISGNTSYGINISYTSPSVANGNNLIQGNFIGTDVTGTISLRNHVGVIIWYNSFGSNTIGGTVPGARNLISGNTSFGLDIREGGKTGNLVQGNYIGTDVTGTKSLKNYTGLNIQSNSNTIGGETPGAGNLVSGNEITGVWVKGTANRIQGNYIGTDVTGTKALGNGATSLNYSGAGIEVYEIANVLTSNTIGGTAPGTGNIISANKRAGVYIYPVAGVLAGTRVQGNYIGTDVTGTQPLGNGFTLYNGSGVVASGTRAIIGGTAPGAGNIIAFNTSDGVRAVSTNAIQHNSIFSNGNRQIAAPGSVPVLSSAVSSNGSLTIGGSLTSTANATYVLEFFSNPTAASGGKTYLGSITVTTNATGTANFNATFAVTVAPGQFITASATDPLNSTSAFSNSRLVT